MSTLFENRTRQAIFVLSAGALAGILIWSKLRLVTDIPRSAYAVPESEQPATPDEPSVIDPETPDPQDETETGTPADASVDAPADASANAQGGSQADARFDAIIDAITGKGADSGSENHPRPNGGDDAAADAPGPNAMRTDAGRP